MADSNRGERAWTTDALEHDDTANVGVKRVASYVWNTSTLKYERPTDNTRISYAVDKDDASDYYFASYLRDGSWRIEKMSKTTGISTYATGSSGIEENWTNRTTLTYGNL